MAETIRLPLAELLCIGSFAIAIYISWQLVSAAASKVDRSSPLALAALSLSVAGYQLCYIYVLPSTDLSLHSTVLKCQAAMLPFIYISLFLFLALYTQKRRILPWAIALAVPCLGLFVANLTSPFSLRIDTLVSFEPGLLPWGEQVRLLRGQPGIAANAALLTGMLLVAWGWLRCWRLAEQQRTQAARLLTTALALPPLLLLSQWLSDAPLLHWLDAAGLGWFAMVMLMTHSLRLEQPAPEPDTALMDETEHLLSDPNQWEMVVNQSPSCIQVLNLQGQVIRTNLTSRRFWQRDLCDSQDAGLASLLELNDLDLEVYFSDLPEGEHRDLATLQLQQHQDYHGLTPAHTTWMRFRGYPLRSASGEAYAVVIYHQEVTAEHNAETAIKEIAKGLTSEYGPEFFDNLVLTLAKLFDAKMAFIGLQEQPGNWTRIATHSLCSDGKIVDNLAYDLADTPCANVVGHQTCVYPREVQSLFPYDLMLQELGIESYIGTPIRALDNQPIGIMVVLDTKPLTRVKQVQEILEILAARAGAELQRRNAEAKMRQMAYQDYLTRLPNRALLHQHLSDTLKQCRNHGRSAVMYLLDLDHFKTINDTLGHDVGDEVIRGVGQTLREHLDESLFVARMGGDEFVVVQGCAPEEVDRQAHTLASELIDLMAKPLQVGDRLLNAGCSIGVVTYPDGLPCAAPSKLDLLRYADIALYQAKSNGRHQYVLFEPELQEKINRRIEIERGLRDALQNDQFEIHYQPQVCSDGEVMGVEALLRWHTPHGQPISPATFIPVAEETGLVLKLGHWVFNAVFRQVAHWKQQGCCPPRVSINVSAWQFAQKDFVEQLMTQLQRENIQAERFVLELTETALLQDIEDAINKLRQLRAAGFGISLDDFGTGYSSLAYLKDLPLDEFKIDKAFVDELNVDGRQPLVESMIAIGQHMSLGVIAEGIETPQQRALLEAMGCKAFQGYLYGRPMPAGQLQHWLLSRQEVAPS